MYMLLWCRGCEPRAGPRTVPVGLPDKQVTIQKGTHRVLYHTSGTKGWTISSLAGRRPWLQFMASQPKVEDEVKS